MDDERFIDLETRLAHQDQLLHQLNEVVTDQQARIMQLEDLCKSMIERLQSMGETGQAATPEHERPPHY